eukprot:1570879-Alexandrium_andersonii.AAC.1
MSASLVGSEMCIRDRRSPWRARRRRRGHKVSIRGAARSRRVRGLQPGPVSYTHLTLPTICSV